MNRSKNRKQSCVAATCAHYLTVKGRQRNQMTIEEVDWEHLYNEHTRAWGQYAWEQFEQRQTEIDRLNAELATYQRDLDKVRAENIKLRSDATRSSSPRSYMETLIGSKLIPKAISLDISVDPVHHIDGFCDALMISSGIIYKCTEHVRYNHNVCGAHLQHKYVIKPPEKPAEKMQQAPARPSQPRSLKSSCQSDSPSKSYAEVAATPSGSPQRASAMRGSPPKFQISSAKPSPRRSTNPVSGDFSPVIITAPLSRKLSAEPSITLSSLVF